MHRRHFLKVAGIASTGLLSSFTFPISFDEPVRGIYVSGWRGIGTKSIDSTISFMKSVKLNTLLIDIKNAHGEVFFESKNDIGKSLQVKTGEGYHRKLNLNYLQEQTTKNNIRLIARHVMFRDKGLYIQQPQWQLHKENQEYWVDMRNQDVVNYNLSLLEEEKQFGFDEIVLDYIRYPAVAKYDIESRRCEVIDTVVKQAKKVVSPIDLGVQIFGYSAWHHLKSGVGQRMGTLAKHADVIYPMIYPSHFWKGSFGYENPNDHPYEFIDLGCKASLQKTDSDTKVMPMLQAFHYPAQKIALQIQASKDNNMPGYIFWNPKSNYTKLVEAYKLIK